MEKGLGDQAEEVSAAEEVSVAQEKCTRQLVQSAARNAKFLSSQAAALTASQDLYTAGIATPRENQLNFRAN